MAYTREQAEKETLKYFNGDELARDVAVKKYLLSDGDKFLELTPDDMHWRLASEFARAELNYNNPLSKEDIYPYLKEFKKICPQGSPMYAIGNPKPVSASNCFVVESPVDSISGILEAGKNLANIYKRRGGVGIDISTLRPDGAKVNNASKTSTGAWSFADFYSYITRMIGQNNRRGALMITMDIRHPDIENFITMKQDLKKVTGANVSVKITDDFMEALEANEEWELRWPIDSKNPKITRTVKASHIWELIVDSATKTAEPGIIMWDNLTKTLPAHYYERFKTLTVNPCSEIGLSPFDACRLISNNLKWFVKNPFTEYAYFDFEDFEDTVRMSVRLGDNLVDLELEKVNQIIMESDDLSEKQLWENIFDSGQRGRRIGIGTHGLADAIARLGMRYDSDSAIEFINTLYTKQLFAAYDESVNLAIQRGPFPEFDWEKEKNCVLFKHLPETLKAKMAKYGRRNIALLTNAPTGSVSILSQTSSGIEPVFRNSYSRRRKISDGDSVVDYVDDLGQEWQMYEVFHHNLKEYFGQFHTDKIPDYFVTSDQIDWHNRVVLQSVMSKLLDHSISSTINLPKGTSTKVVDQIYRKGWKLGLKGITVYVDGSRSGVLVTKEDKKTEGFPTTEATKRPNELPCDVQRVRVNGEDWVLFVGLLDDRPYEVFGGKLDKIDLDEKYLKGKIVKRPRKTVRSKYDLQINGITIKDIVGTFENEQYGTLTRLISLSLRHGADIEYIVSQLMKDRESSIFSFQKVVATALKKYIKDGQKSSGEKDCMECGAKDSLIYQEGCLQCSSCGYAKCG